MLTILKRELRREKYFGRSYVLMAAQKNIRDANLQLVRDRIPQLEKAIEILTGYQSPVTSYREPGNRKQATGIINQLNLFA